MVAKISTEKAEAAVLAYTKTLSAVRASTETGVSTSKIYRLLAERGIDRQQVRAALGKPHHNSKLTYAQVEAAADRYRAGEVLEKIAKDAGVSCATVAASLRKIGVKISPRGNKPLKITAEMTALMQRLWDDGHTQSHIAEQVGVHQSTVSSLLLTGRVVVGERKMRRSRLDYKPDGGFTLVAGGYRLIHWRRAPAWVKSMANSSGYIPEHRVVMAKMLGRTLSSSETVHHIDGDKLNNRPQNLQLRQGKHGKGVVLRCACCGSTDVRPERIA